MGLTGNVFYYVIFGSIFLSLSFFARILFYLHLF